MANGEDNNIPVNDRIASMFQVSQPQISPINNLQQSSTFQGAPAQLYSQNRFTPQQQALLAQMGQMGFQGLQALNRPVDTSGIEREARENFHKDTVPRLMDRFAKRGTGAGSVLGSGFHQAVAGAGQDLESKLARFRNERELQERQMQQNSFQNMLSHGLKPQFQTDVIPGQQSGAKNFIQQATPGILQAANSMISSREGREKLSNASNGLISFAKGGLKIAGKIINFGSGWVGALMNTLAQYGPEVAESVWNLLSRRSQSANNRTRNPLAGGV